MARGRRLRRSAAAVLAASAVLAAPAAADEFDSKRSGHPLRILAYMAHPFGVILNTLVFRPAHWAVMHEPMKTLFGHTDPSDSDY